MGHIWMAQGTFFTLVPEAATEGPWTQQHPLQVSEGAPLKSFLGPLGVLQGGA